MAGAMLPLRLIPAGSGPLRPLSPAVKIKRWSPLLEHRVERMRGSAVTALSSSSAVQNASTENAPTATVETLKLACPVCYQPLIQLGQQGFHPKVVDRSSFRCESCQKPYCSMGGIIDLTISAGNQDLEEVVPLGAALFQNPVVAYIYDRGYRDIFGIFNFPGFDEEFKMAQALLKSARAGVIMDVSCGGGSFARRFLASRDYNSVIASDFSEAMLENCLSFLEQDSAVDLTKVHLIRADVARLPFATASLSAVHAGAAIHCWPLPTTAVAEISRVLKPGGVFVASTFLLPIPPSTLSGVFTPIRRTIMQLGLPFQWWTESEIREITEACGLVSWKSIRRGYYILFSVCKPE